MSGFFKDSVFENLDDISQMVEPFQCRFNDELHKLPDCIELGYKDVLEHFTVSRYGGFGSIEMDKLLKIHTGDPSVDWVMIRHELRNFFKFQIGDGEDDVMCYFDLDNQQLTNSIALIKYKSGYSDDELYKMMTDNLRQRCRGNMRKASQLYKSNINDVAEVFDIEGVHKERALKTKRDLLVDGLLEQFNDRKINIRNFELGLRFTRWITAYICDNNAAAIKNITLFKVMMLNGRPIYSIDNEEQL